MDFKRVPYTNGVDGEIKGYVDLTDIVNEADLNERMAETTHENSNCNLPIVRFSEARAEVCKQFDYWKTCESWTKDCRCLKSCEYHLLF